MANATTGQTGQNPDVSGHAPVLLTPASDARVTLPHGVEIGNCALSRDGQNLVLTAPDGQTYVVEGYFSLPDQPVLHDASGAVLTPQLVNSFVKSANDIQIAAADQTSDKSPVGEVTEVTGNATVTHADGSHEKITAGTHIFEGDIIETDAKGAVNIKFADDSTFAVSENARMSVDDFSFNPSDQHGSTGLSILRGVFMFTSGLVGRENPDAVHINTPVGSIGIRGTIIGGHIVPDGQSQISVLEGAIVVRNGSGETILSQQFETVHLTGYAAPITNIGTLDATGISQSYDAVRGVSSTLFTSIDDAAHDAPRANGTPDNGTPSQAAPDAAPTGSDATPENKPQTTPQDTMVPDAPHAQQQGAQTQAAADALRQAVVTDTTQSTVFQTLQSGSGIDNPLTLGEGSNTPAPQVTPVNTLPPPPPVQPFTPPATPVVEAPPQITRDTRPPTAPLFVDGGTVAEESHAGTIVGRLGMSGDMPFPVTYTLVSDPDNVFAIDASTGVVTLKGYAGDSEAGMTHHDLIVRVTRTDTNQSAESALTVSVLPVDETPHFNTGLSAQTTSEGSYVVLSAASVGATDPESAPLTYTVTASTKGHIEVGGITATTFTATQLSGGLVRYVHDGSEPGGASYTLTVSDDTGHTSAARQFDVTINPVNDAPVQAHSAGGTLSENGEIPITNTQLLWTDPDNLPSEIVYTLTSTTHGVLQKYVSGSWTTLAASDTFTQADVNTDKIRFSQDTGEFSSASVAYTVTDGIAAPTAGNLNFTVTPVNDAPTAIARSDFSPVLEGGSLAISSAILGYSDVDNTTSELTYTIVSTAHGSVEHTTNGGATWTSLTDGQTFTQADIASGAVRFTQNGDETTTASLQYTLSDGTVSTSTQTLAFTVTPVNDPVAAAAISSSTSFLERVASGAPAVDLGVISITDAEPVTDMSASNFAIQSFNGTSWVADSRFSVTLSGGVWHLQANAGQAFDHETEPSVTLRVTVTDGGGSVTTGSVVVSIGDANDTATSMVLNNGIQYTSGTTDALVQGHMDGAIIGVLSAVDTDTASDFRPSAANYTVTATSGSTLTVSNFQIVDVTQDDGSIRTVLKLVDGIYGNFATGGTTLTVTVRMDANQNGSIDGADITRTFTFTGRNDTMVLEMVNGDNGFRIINDARYGGNIGFASAIAVGDFNADGHRDIVFGAPTALNGDATPLQSGGIYAFYNNAAIKADAVDGQTLLSVPVNNTDDGFFREGTAAAQAYGASIAAMRNFDGTAGSDLAVSVAGSEKIEIIHNGNTSDITTITNVPTGSPGSAAKGIVLTALGDVNGDGLSDLLVGTPYHDGTYANQGSAYVVFGTTSHTDINLGALGANGVALTGPTATDNDMLFGSSVAALRDFNGDGYADFAIASPGADTNGATAGISQGQVTIYYGGTGFNGSQTYAINGSTNEGLLGSHIANGGDFNGDGYSEIMIHAPAETAGGSIYVVMGYLGATGSQDLSSHMFKITAGTSGYSLDSTFGSAGDFNGDGYSDLYVDMVKNLGSGQYEHTLAIIYGKSTGLLEIDLTTALNDPAQTYKIRMLESTSADITVTGAGDINGDGYDDLIIGNASHANGGTPATTGDAYVVFGDNYDGKATDTGTSIAATSNGMSFDGDANTNTLTTGTYTGISFRGGAGDDIMAISTSTAVRRYDGGAGNDTLKLFFSGEETVTPATDTIDLRGIGKLMTGVENIELAAGSQKDLVQLRESDVLSLVTGADNANHQFIIKAMDTQISANQNTIALYDASSNTGNLANVGFTKDANSDSQQDTTVIGGQTFYVYTHQSGAELLVDARIANASGLGG